MGEMGGKSGHLCIFTYLKQLMMSFKCFIQGFILNVLFRYNV